MVVCCPLFTLRTQLQILVENPQTNLPVKSQYATYNDIDTSI